MKNLLILLLILVMPWGVKGQLAKKQGDKEYKHYNYSLAIQHYNQYLKRHKANGDLALNLAEAYRKTNNTEVAATWFANALQQTEFTAEQHLHYGNVLKANGDYMEALDQYNKYGKKVENDDEKKYAREMVKSCYIALEWIAYPEQVDIKNEKQLNSPQSEFSPVYANGKLIVATDRKLPNKVYTENEIAGWTGNPYLEIVEMVDDTLPIPFSKVLSGPYHDGPAAFSPTGDTVFFTRTFKVKSPKTVLKSAGLDKAVTLFINRLELWYSVKKAGVWQVPQAFPYNNKMEYSLGHASFSANGKTLYFVSDMKGGLGETDIYYSTLSKNGEWEKPVNLGPVINTPFKEVFPTVKDSLLYFSSNKPSGMGGLDIYMANGSKTTWNKVENLKYPINSSKDDFSILVDSTGKAGYFASNRKDGLGSDDIYHFQQPGCILSGITLERIVKGENIILDDVLIELYRKGDTSEVIGYSRSSAENKLKVCLRSYQPCKMMHNAKGKFFFQLQQNVKYEIKASKEGYFSQTIDVPDDCRTPGDTINLAVLLTKIELNKPIVVNDLFFDENDKMYFKENIFFDLDKANIREDATITLDKLVNLLVDNPTLKVELGAHTDSRHSKQYNNTLSQKRAESAVTYISAKNIGDQRIFAKGYGETQLLNECADGINCPEDKHQQNRRVEIKIVEILPEAFHIVNPNETLYSISKKYKTSIEKLMELNSLTEEKIYAGDKIKIK